MTRLAREPSHNPSVYVYHTTRELTAEIVDERPPSAVWEIPGVARATANRYRVRIHRRPDVEWEELLPDVDAAMLAHLGAASIEPCPEDDDHRRFPLPAPVEKKRVYEGVCAAAGDPLGAALFRVGGVAEAVFEGAEVTVRKGRLFAWADLEPAVRAALGGPSA